MKRMQRLAKAAKQETGTRKPMQAVAVSSFESAWDPLY